MPSSIPLLSVILPAYNSSRTLASCLSSLKQNLADFSPGEVEVIAPARKSIDETRQMLVQFRDLKILDHDEVGIAPAYNLGVANSRGRSAVFLNSDDELGPGYLKTMVNLAFQREPDRHVVYSSVLFINSCGESLYTRNPAPYFSFIQKHYSIILHPNAIYPMVLLRKHPFEVLPGAPPRDREQVYELMKEAIWSRTSEVHYRYRIWSSSGTVMLAKRVSAPAPLRVKLVRLAGRLLVQSHESHLVSRVISRKLGRVSYWRQPT